MNEIANAITYLSMARDSALLAGCDSQFVSELERLIDEMYYKMESVK